MTTGAMHKRKYIPGQSGLRKCQKNTEKLQRSTLTSYQQFIKVFSAQGNRINVLSFSMCQASRVTRYKFGVSTKSTLKDWGISVHPIFEKYRLYKDLLSVQIQA